MADLNTIIINGIPYNVGGGGTGDGVTEDVKQALLQLASKVAYIDEDGQDYYDDLYDALYPPAPPATLVRITAVYTQTGTVYDADTLDSLKANLVVTAYYSNGTSNTVSNYTLSGTLAVGTSTIAVSYGGKTATFNVVVSESYVRNGLIMWLDGEYNGENGSHNTTLTTWVDQSGNGWDWTNINASVGDKYIQLDSSAWLTRPKNSLPTNVKMMEVVFCSDPASTSGGILMSGFGDTVPGNMLARASHAGVLLHTGTTQYENTAFDIDTSNLHAYNSAGYIDGTEVQTSLIRSSWQYKYPCIGRYLGDDGEGTGTQFRGKIYSIRLYDRILSASEIAYNFACDAARFGLVVS